MNTTLRWGETGEGEVGWGSLAMDRLRGGRGAGYQQKVEEWNAFHNS